MVDEVERNVNALSQILTFLIRMICFFGNGRTTHGKSRFSSQSRGISGVCNGEVQGLKKENFLSSL